jgi:hypothetical protein
LALARRGPLGPRYQAEANATPGVDEAERELEALGVLQNRTSATLL